MGAMALALAAGARAAQPTLGIGTVPKPPATMPAAAENIGLDLGQSNPVVQPPMTVTLGNTQARDKWEVGDPASGMLSAIAGRFGVILIAPKFNAVVLKAGELPKTLDDAVSMARDNLEPQGWGIVQTLSGKPDPRVILRVEPLKQAQDAQVESGPVTSGDDAGVIDIKHPGQPVTHLLKVNHAELLNRLQQTATQDPDVSVDLVGSAPGGYTLIFSGPAAKVKKAVQSVAAIDQVADETPAVRAMKLTHLDAVATALNLNADFQRQGKAGMRAVADRRTNTLIVSGPEDDVVSTMVTLLTMDLAGKAGGDQSANPTAAPATESGTPR